MFENKNEYWKIRSKDGRDKQYTPESFLEASNDYFKWCVDNPLNEETIVKYRDSYEKVNISKMRAFTIEGFCNFLDISVQTFYNYAEYPDFVEIVTRVRQIIYNQKFEGSAANLLNSNIIARDLGLVDKKEQTIKEEPRVFKIDSKD